MEFRIFTLLGELVYEATYDANAPQGQAGAHTKDLFWDGYNGDGKMVLNGVYVAVLKTATGTVTTKVAVAK